MRFLPLKRPAASRSPAPPHSALKPLPSEEIWGGVEVIEGEAPVFIYENVICLPQWWALFDEAGVRIEETAFRRHGGTEVIGSPPSIDFDRSALVVIDEEVVYGGVFHPHFGHFLCSSLGRLWAWGRYQDHRLLFQGETFEWAQTNALGRLAFDQAKVDSARVLELDRPTLFRRIIVPRSGFEEQWRAYSTHRAVCLELGRTARIKKGPPVYLSKSKLKPGPHAVQRIMNEHVVERYLSSRGVEIVHPEAMHIEDQLGLFASDRPIIGFAGSAFHLHLFVPPNRRSALVQPVTPMVSNQVLIDKLSGRQAVYLIPEDHSYEARDAPEGFSRNTVLADPTGIAMSLLAVVS